jgi:hypothetical protein
MTPPNGTTPTPTAREALVAEIAREVEDHDRPVTMSAVRQEVGKHELGCSIREYITGLKAQIRLSVFLLGIFGIASIGAGIVIGKLVINSTVESAVDRGLEKRLPAIRLAIEQVKQSPTPWHIIPPAAAADIGQIASKVAP